MELGRRIREYRGKIPLTQEELAEKLFVSRQTVSSWENDRSYPDIHSLLMLSELFAVSLDQLVKGDIEIMKEKIDESAIAEFSRQSNIFAVLMIVMVVSAIPLLKWLGLWGMAIWAVIVGITIWYAFRVEKTKKAYDVQTYKEICAFMNGEKLEGDEKTREEGKRPYQKALAAVLCAVIAFAVCLLLAWALK